MGSSRPGGRTENAPTYSDVTPGRDAQDHGTGQGTDMGDFHKTLFSDLRKYHLGKNTIRKEMKSIQSLHLKTNS